MTVASFRVVHLDTEKTWRGGERQLFWLARDLKRRGHGSWVACRPGSPLWEKSRSADLAVFPLRAWSEFDPLAVWRLRRLLHREKIHILHAHTGRAAGLARLAVMGTRTRLVATRRVDFPLRSGPWGRWKYSSADRLVAISDKVRSVLSQSGVSRRDVAVVPSGIDPDSYPSVERRTELRREYRVPEDAVVVVNAAALVPHKDQVNFLRALPAVLRAQPRLRAWILGKGPLEGDLRSLATGLGLSEVVDFMGHREEVLDFMAMADCFVLSSSEEGLGTVLLDAMAVGIPTVATRAGGIPELYPSGAADLVAPRDPSALAREMIRVLSDSSLAQRRVKEGRESVARFSVERMAGEYEKIYGTLV